MFEPSTGTEKKDFSMYTIYFNRTMQEVLKPLLATWEGKIVTHSLPDHYAETLQLIDYADLLKSTLLPIEEFADYKDLKSFDPPHVLDVIDDLATSCAESYYWNIRLTVMKDGTGLIGKEIHVTDLGTLKVNIAGNGPAGWVAFRYKFAGTKFTRK